MPVDERMFPKPTNGETTPPAAKQMAPSKAEAVPAFSRWQSMANAVVEVKVSPMKNSKNSISPSYTQKLHPNIKARHWLTAITTMPQQPANVLLSCR